MIKNYPFNFLQTKTRKFLLVFAVFVLVCVNIFSQTVLISPTGDGGFENATSTLAANGWTQVGTGNAWWVGTAAGSVAGGTKAAFLGPNNTSFGGSISYGIKHFYRDIAIPAGATQVYLNYYLRVPTIDNGWDFFYIYINTTAQTPVSGSLPAGTQKVSYTTPTIASFTAQPQIDLTAYAGTTIRLVFTYKDDGASPYAYCAVDNISLTYIPACTAPTTQASSVVATATANTTATVTWARGNGDNVMVVARTGAASNPASGTAYGANASYGAGTAVGGGWCVYNGTGTSVNVTNLVANTTYNFDVYEYANTGTCYKTPAANGNTKTFNDGNNVNQPGSGGSASYIMCSGNYYDVGGAGGSYTANLAASTVTFYPSVSGNKVRITFSSFNTEGATCATNYDWLKAFDGNSTGATQIGCYSSAPGTPPGTITSTAADGSLTFQFKSDGTPNGTGWVAAISCIAFVPNCANINTPANGGTNLCPTTTTLNWTAPGSGPAPTGYRVYFGTDAGATNIQNGLDVGNVLTWNPGALSNNTLYYWKIVPYNAVGPATGCSTWSFTTGQGGAVAAATAITGLAAVCQGATGVAYSIAGALANASTYVWSFGGAGGSIASGTGTISITENFSAAATSGNISVYGSNACGNGVASNKAVTVNTTPAQPSVITGATNPCQGSSQAYSVVNVGGVTYTWGFPAGWTQTGGTTTNSITATVGAGAGNITVTPSVGTCGGTARTLAVTVNTVPAQPSVITGLTSPCSGSSQVYSVVNVASVNYAWTFPAAGSPLWSQTGGGVTNSITASAGSASGNITVTPSNVCGNGTARTLAVTPGAGPVVLINGSNPATTASCGGVGVVITASGSTNYTWLPTTGLSNPAIANPTATPTVNTTYTVTETTSGCGNQATVTVGSGPIVTATASVLPITACPGQTVNLTGGATQGTSTIYSENFETFGANVALPTGGWAQYQVTASANSWEVSSSGPLTGTRSLTIYNGANHKQYINSDDCDKVAYSPLINTTGYTQLKLNFKWACTGEYSSSTYYDYGMVVWSTNGTTWTDVSATKYNVQTGSSGTVSNLDLSAANGQTFYLGFRWKDDTSAGANPPFTIDDISVTGVLTAPPFSYSWTSNPAGYTSLIQSPTATPAVNTTYTLVVTQTTSLCTGTAGTATVTMNAVPATPAFTASVASACASTAGLVYTVGAVANATSYNWTVPAGSTITTGSGTTSITVTLGASNGNVTCVAVDACGRTSGTLSLAVTSLAAPGAPATTTGATVCGVSGSVTLSATGGGGYNWYSAAVGGASLGTGASYITPVLTTATTYYVALNNGSCDGPRVAVTADIANGGLDTYTASQGALAYPGAIGGTAVTSWKNGTSTDDNMSTAVPIGFSFPFNGGFEQNVMITTNGLITFNTATKANGADLPACGTPEPYTWQNDNFSLTGKLGSLQSIAPFYNDLACRNSLNTSIYYSTTGGAPNRIFKIEWKKMYNDWTDNSSSPDYCDEVNGNLNFQVWLYETSGNIEFYYGTMNQTAPVSGSNCSYSYDIDYTVGINSSTLTATPNSAQLFCQQTANTATFSSTAQNNLTTLPTANTRIVLTRTVPAAPVVVPSVVCSVADNYPVNASTNQCLNQILSWAAGDGQPTNYDVYFGTVAAPPFVANTTHTYYDPGALAMNTTFYWKIVPKNAIGTGTASAVWSFSTTVGDVAPTEITSNVGTLISHAYTGLDVLGRPVFTNTYEVCSGLSGGTITAVDPKTAEGSVVDWTNPLWFIDCTDAIPADFSGNCDGPSHSPIWGFTAWLTSIFNGGNIVYDVFTRGCNQNVGCTRVILTTVDPSVGTISSANQTVCAGDDPTAIAFTSAPNTSLGSYTYQWYSRPGDFNHPGNCNAPAAPWVVIPGASGSGIVEIEDFTAPPGTWTFTGTTYIATCNGTAAPSVEFDNSADLVTSKTYSLPVVQIKYRYGASTWTGGAASTLKLEAWNGSAWTTINTSAGINAFPLWGCYTQIATYSFTVVQNYTKFRWSITKNGNNLMIDDVTAALAPPTLTYDPPSGIAATTSYACYITAGGIGGCGVSCWATGSYTVFVNAIPAAPTAPDQPFCTPPTPTIADLTATGTGIQWYAASSGGAALAAGTALTSGTTYYATQTVSSCQSTARDAALVTLNPTPTALAGTLSCPLASNGNRILKVTSSGGTSYGCTGCVSQIDADEFYVAPSATAAITATC